MNKTLLIVIVAVISGVLFGGIGYFIAQRPIPQLIQERDAARSELTQLRMEANAVQVDEQKHPITIALNTPPDPTFVKEARLLDNGLVWVWAMETGTDVQGRTNTSWIIDTETERIIDTRVRQDSAPMDPTVTFPPAIDDRYNVVKWENGWEGFWTEITDYYDRSTGVLHYTLENKMNHELHAISEDKKLKITLDPERGCDEVLTDASKRNVTVNGLLINDIAYPFSEPKIVECTVNEFHGAGYYPEFKSWTLFRTDEGTTALRIGLPWGERAEIYNMDPETLTFR
ncbi:hypothetical protein GF380_06145 [Candidatus Uhrbacteria bacterium]|nr:hypothetical protein [Candidatus Uhrbacteria bacterium]MBD3284555.1 hypothetical protein [Candidatus Uhrbacteria bacterium]